MAINIEKIGKAAEMVEDDLKELEERIIIMKVRFVKGSISKQSLLQDMDKLLEIIRR